MKKSRTLFPFQFQHIRLGYKSERNKWRNHPQVVRSQYSSKIILLNLNFSNTAFQEHGRTKRTRLSTVDELQANTETHHSDELNLFNSIAEGSEMYTSQTVTQVSCLYLFNNCDVLSFIYRPKNMPNRPNITVIQLSVI